MRYRYTAFCVRFPLLVLLCASAAHAADPWWNPKWRYRREITIEDTKPTRLGGTDIITVEIATGGVSKPDGSDIRVTTSMGKEVVSTVLMTGPGDRARLAFAKKGSLKKYYAYLGNPDAPPRRAVLPIRRGVLLETYRCRADPPRKFSDAQKIFQKPGAIMGRRFVDRMFLGYNPFGPDQAVANLMTGYVTAPKSGEYTFSCSSNNASFLLVDDKLLISNGGWHRAQRDIRKNAKINLKAGLHKLTFYHINRKSNPVLVVAWKAPGEKRVRVIPPAAYSLVHAGKSGTMQQVTKRLDIDFSPVYAGETFAANRYYQRYSFVAQTVGREGKGLKWAWDFGDGQVSTEDIVDHVYITDGMYTVTLTAKVPRGQLIRTNRIYVSRPWDRITHRKLDSTKDHAAIIATYNFETLKSDAVGPAFELLKRNELTKDMIRACTAFLKRTKLPADGVSAIVPVVSDLLLENAQTNNAVKILLVAADKCDSPETSARMTIRAARIVLDVVRDDKEAMKLLARTQNRYGKKIAPATARDAQIGIADVWRARGDYEKASAAYKTAGFGPEAARKKHPILRGDLARHVESYTQSSRNYEWAEQYIQRWSQAFPADKLDGYLSLLTARLWMVQGRYSEVTVEADILTRVNPTSNYGAQLLMLAVEAYRKMDKPDKASETLKRIVKVFPESPLAIEAAEKLKKK
ncbi:MAG: PKD domain-containing protein [Phycisphaerae bacterium]|jgi:PKD repeat protein|nr:PKD domain-containing protein [Phycisphaerae bacterium]